MRKYGWVAIVAAIAASLAASGPAFGQTVLAAGTVNLKTGLNHEEQDATGTPGDPDGSGNAKLQFNTVSSVVCYTINTFNIGAEQLAHVHKAPPGTTNFVPAVTLYTDPVGTPNPRTGCVQSDPLTVQDIIANPTAYYVAIHTLDFPEGALRGQLGDKR